MLTFKRGDIFKSGADALVNPVNCAGAMGAGLAAEFKERFPRNFIKYQRACHHGEVEPGKLLIVENWGKPQWIVNFPTKRHWQNPSRMEDITAGLETLRQWCETKPTISVAVPALGAGLGGLEWDDVRAEIERVFADLRDGINVLVYHPRQPRDSRRKRP